MGKIRDEEKINNNLEAYAKKKGLRVGRVHVKEKPLKITYSQKVSNDMLDLYLNPASVLHCGECKERLGVLHTLRYALFKPQGTAYFVPCKRCGHSNKRIKGMYKDNVSQQWKDLQDQLDAKHRK